MLKLYCLLLLAGSAQAQPCISVTASSPYLQNFETTNGGWVIGGTASDWAWGTPTKPLINGAASGSRCWITGGLTNSFYNLGESAWIMSPCFDLSTLQYPELRLKLFWETERLYDGTAFEYSLDDGASWTTLGDINSIPHCKGTNWYNTNTVFAGNFHSWSGNIQPEVNACVVGNGTGTWVIGRHILEEVAGAANVRFRFVFTAGTTCNNYDGFAMDDFAIVETSPDPVYFDNVVCISADEKQFFLSGNCPGLTLWDFGDPASGTANNSNVLNPIHKFSAPGRYTVTVRTATTTGFTKILTREVVVIGADTTINWPGRCDDIPNATITAVPTGANTPYTYLWNTSPPQTGQSINNVGPGNYSVKINAANACELTVNFNLSPDQKMRSNVVTSRANCYTDNGSIATNISGGTSPYTYTWSGGASGANPQNLAPGLYNVSVKDKTGCVLDINNIRVVVDTASLLVNLGEDVSICTGETIVLDAGSFDNYLWQDGSTGNSFSVTTGGTYIVKVSNNNGCTGSDTIQIPLDCSDLYFPGAFTPNADNLNDEFGALGTQVPYIRNYQLNIYDRAGQLIFSSQDPYYKWNGMYKAIASQAGTYVWAASYSLNGRKRFRKGSVILLR